MFFFLLQSCFVFRLFQTLFFRYLYVIDSLVCPSFHHLSLVLMRTLNYFLPHRKFCNCRCVPTGFNTKINPSFSFASQRNLNSLVVFVHQLYAYQIFVRKSLKININTILLQLALILTYPETIELDHCIRTFVHTAKLLAM